MRGYLRVLARDAVRRVSYGAIGVLGGLARLRRAPRAGGEVRRILVCRLDLLGDVLFTRPLVQGLRARYPNADITVLTLPYTGPLAGLYPEVDEVVTIDTNRIRSPRGLLSPSTWRQYLGVARRLRRERFDLGVSVCGRMASLCVYLAGAHRVVGYAGEGYPFLLDEALPGGRYRERKHEVEYVRALGEFAGAVATPQQLTIEPPAESARRMETRLQALGIEPVDRLVLIHAGAVNGSAKRWPAAQWARFAEGVTAALPVKIVLAGAASDEPIARHVCERTGTPIVSLVGQTSVPDLVALVRRADLVASGDSGPLHLAVALGRPLVAVYGPTDPRVHGPYHPTGPVQVHRADIPCSPCYSMAATAECPLGDPICMRLVPVERMVASALELLSG